MMGWMAPSRHQCAKVGLRKTNQREPSMNQISIVGLDIAKKVFQVHGVMRLGL